MTTHMAASLIPKPENRKTCATVHFVLTFGPHLKPCVVYPSGRFPSQPSHLKGGTRKLQEPLLVPPGQPGDGGVPHPMETSARPFTSGSRCLQYCNIIAGGSQSQTSAKEGDPEQPGASSQKEQDKDKKNKIAKIIFAVLTPCLPSQMSPVGHGKRQLRRHRSAKWMLVPGPWLVTTWPSMTSASRRSRHVSEGFGREASSGKHELHAS